MKISIPKVTLFDSYPFTAMRDKLIHLSAGAERCEAAVAFVTRAGCDLVRSICEANQIGFDLVASVRFPTNLPQLTRLSSRPDTDVHLHLGYKTPMEPKADRGQFHSKLVSFCFADGRRVLVVGSHNWTGNGLDGDNLEASVIIECDENDRIARDAHLHFLHCKGRSQPLDPTRLMFYQAIQHSLHCGPRTPNSVPIPGFETETAVVIHAETSGGVALKNDFRLYVPISSIGDEFLSMDQRVILFVHNPGTLLGRQVISDPLQVLTGQVTMANRVSDSPVTGRDANAEIRDLLKPVITPLAGNIPAVTNERRQVMVLFESLREQALPIFHCGASPKLTQKDVLWRMRDRDEFDSPDVEEELIGMLTTGMEEMRGASEREDEERLSPETIGLVEHDLDDETHFVECAQELELSATIQLPARWMYDQNLERQFLSLLHSRNLIPIQESPNIVFKAPAAKQRLGDYIYFVSHKCTQETIDRAATQLGFDF